jgi:hypothetical protein
MASAAHHEYLCHTPAAELPCGTSEAFMLTLFWFALVLGGGLAAFSLLGDFFGSDGGVDHLHVEHDTADSHWQLFSLRTVTYFLFAFGAAGVLILKASGGDAPVLATAGALFTGIVSAFASSALFSYIGRTGSGTMETDSSFEGLAARVVLPLRGGHGKIMVERSGREIELMAQCYDADAADPETWKQVVIVEIKGGTALVSPLHEFERADALLPRETEI